MVSIGHQEAVKGSSGQAASSDSWREAVEGGSRLVVGSGGLWEVVEGSNCREVAFRG